MSVLALRREQYDQAVQLLPSEVVDYLDAGSGAEVTRGEADSSWHRYRLRPRVLTDVGAVDTTTRLLGTRLAGPILVAPTAYHGLCHPDGERATARGTRAGGSLMTLSTR